MSSFYNCYLSHMFRLRLTIYKEWWSLCHYFNILYFPAAQGLILHSHDLFFLTFNRHTFCFAFWKTFSGDEVAYMCLRVICWVTMCVAEWRSNILECESLLRIFRRFQKKLRTMFLRIAMSHQCAVSWLQN